MSRPGITRHFLPWDRPLLAQAVGWLAGDWAGTGPLDLARTRVVVPTRQAGRRLREALAEHAAAHHQAVFPPEVVTPEALVSTDAPDVASRLVSLLVWAETFRELDLAAVSAVFPATATPPARNFAWALRLAREFCRLQLTLAEGGLTLGDAAARVGDDCPEPERWRQLAEIERLYLEKLATLGRRDAQAAKIAAAHAPAPLIGIDRIVVLATPDPLPLAVQALAAHALALPVEIVVYAPEAEAEQFDEWGRPRATISRRPLVLPDFAGQVQLCADPAAQAARIVTLARGYEAPATRLGIGVADTELLAPLEHGLARAGVAAFNPEGRARRHDALHALLSALAALAEDASFDAAAALLHCPDILEWLQIRARAEGQRLSPAMVLSQLDELREEHLPPTLFAAQFQAQTQAEKFPAIARAFALVADLRSELTRGSFPGNAAAALTQIFAGRRLKADSLMAESAEAWTQTLRDTARALALFPEQPARSDGWNLALAEFAEQTHTDDRPAEALDLLGWLELLWEDAPHLVVAGLNDGKVPDAIVGDPFLPEALRARLGLKTNAARLARDSYLLAALSASRTPGGRLDLLLGKTSTAGDPLRPSRLLLACDDVELPARVALLFRAAPPGRTTAAWHRAWQLVPKDAPPRRKLSVTGFRAWLDCPFRFYLRYVLGLERVDPAKAELDAMDFGSLVHAAVQALGEDGALRECADEAILRDFLLQKFEAAARARYGAELTLPLVVQFESARQRLRAMAGVEARDRADGWRTERVEWPFQFPLGGLTVSGKIDRIDRHVDGRVRVLDYKTSDTAKHPADAHLRSVRASEGVVEEWILAPGVEGKARAWTDLQLPLYRRAVAPEFGDAVICGYFNLPKAAGETAIALWEDYSRDLQASAERCAEHVAAAVLAGEYWPPAELRGREAEYDDFAELFHEGAAASIAWKGASA